LLLTETNLENFRTKPTSTRVSFIGSSTAARSRPPPPLFPWRRKAGHFWNRILTVAREVGLPSGRHVHGFHIKKLIYRTAVRRRGYRILCLGASC